MSIYLQGLEDDLDRKISFEYFAICFCESQKQKAQRLLKPQGNIQYSEQALSNEQLLCYVKDVYLKYGIQDPIQKMRRQRINISLPSKDIQIKCCERQTKTKKKLACLKEKFKNDRQEIIQKQILKTSFKQSSSFPHKTMIENSKKAIGYKTKQKIQFKTVTNEIQTFISPSLLADRLNYSYNHSRCQSLSFSNTNKKQAKKKYIKICPFCEQILSLTNYKNHQKRCNQLKGIEMVSNEALKTTLQLKIAQFQHRIILQLNKKTTKNVVDQFQKLKLDVINWIKMEQNISYEKIQSDFNNFSLGLCKDMSKLQWFRDFHDSLYLSRPFNPYL